MRELGHALFNGLFASEPRTLRLWGKIAERLDDMRVEIVTDAEGATTLPWELLRDPDTDTVLALHAQSFVRAAPGAGAGTRTHHPHSTGDLPAWWQRRRAVPLGGQPTDQRLERRGAPGVPAGCAAPADLRALGPGAA